jgi:PfaB family protein
LTRALDSGGFYLFPLPAASLEDLLASLAILQQSLAGSTDLNALAAETFRAASARADAPYALAVVGHDAAELAREIEFAQKALPGAWESGAEWQTPLGSCFTPHPVGRTGGVALVYPGAFNSYPMVGKDLFRLFPGLFDAMDAVTGDLGGVIHERLLYPRSLAAISKDELAALETKLLADPIAMLVSGTTLAILYTHILQTAFKIRASAAFGYSLGENSMLYATGVWGQGDDAAARIKASETFRARLAGPQLAVREHWGMKYPNGGSADPLWSNYLVMAAPDKVLPALEKEPRVYLTHINAPRQVVIGGDPQGCQRVLAELRASSIQAPFDYALHCEAMRSESGALAELHDWPVEQDPGLRMYTAAGYGPLHLEQAEIARRMAEMLVSPLDFPRLVNRVYDDGARVFIEAGAGGNCARWVSESLKGRPHLSLSLNRRGSDDYSTLVRTLARLSSHRVPLDLSPLYALNGVTSMNSMDEKAL